MIDGARSVPVTAVHHWFAPSMPTRPIFLLCGPARRIPFAGPGPCGLCFRKCAWLAQQLISCDRSKQQGDGDSGGAMRARRSLAVKGSTAALTTNSSGPYCLNARCGKEATNFWMTTLTFDLPSRRAAASQAECRPTSEAVVSARSPAIMRPLRWRPRPRPRPLAVFARSLRTISSSLPESPGTHVLMSHLLPCFLIGIQSRWRSFWQRLRRERQLSLENDGCFVD